MHVDLHQRSADKRRNTPLGKGGVPEETYDVHYAMHKLVCAGAFDDHEWVSESTITQQEEVMGMELDYEIGIPCVVRWCMLWFSAPTRLNGTLEKQDSKIKNVPRSCQHGDHGRNFETIWRRTHTHTEIVHVGISGKGGTQNTQKVGSEHGAGTKAVKKVRKEKPNCTNSWRASKKKGRRGRSKKLDRRDATQL